MEREGWLWKCANCGLVLTIDELTISKECPFCDWKDGRNMAPRTRKEPATQPTPEVLLAQT